MMNQPLHPPIMFITSARIINFRSLNNCEVELSNYTAFVGLNDSGKSNFLRALNLFFNGETDSNQKLSFSHDYCQTAKKLAGKAKEIRIELELAPPQNYADNSPVVWTKIYRAESTFPYTQTFIRKDGQDFAKSSRVDYWARQLAFEYVPAIRGSAFLQVLKRRLYQSLADSVGPRITSASGAFLAELRSEMNDIEVASKRLINLSTEFSLPSDLGSFFESLDFQSSDDHARTPLNYRGDGIQGRHIPLILKFLADQRKKNSKRGRPASETIWGFEEPENNLELIKQVDMANEFATYSQSIQILTSTHSPAFYSIALPDRVRATDRVAGNTTFVDASIRVGVDEQLGLMPFVQPYIQKAMEERDSLLESISELKRNSLAMDKHLLFVEGPTDRTAILSCASALGLDLNFEIVTTDGLDGGANWILGCCVARSALTDVTHRTAALLDRDDAGDFAKTRIRERCMAISRPPPKTFSIGFAAEDDEFRRLKSCSVKVDLSIEEMYGEEAWLYAETHGWLEERDAELITQNAHLLSKTTSINDLINKINPDLTVRRMLEFKVKIDKKGSMANHLRMYLEAGNPPPKSLASMVRKICEYFERA